jgi:hypothetical protein
MVDLILPSDAFSHGQIRSKIWLSEKLTFWLRAYDLDSHIYSLNWYGSWVGLGPFVLLTNSPLKISKMNLFDLEKKHLEASRQVLNYWACEGVEINTFNEDVNSYTHLPEEKKLIFINSACEHMQSSEWLHNIPTNSLVVLQSTNMPHPEHINCHSSLTHFTSAYSAYLNILDSDSIHFTYPDKSFVRFMILGFKK